MDISIIIVGYKCCSDIENTVASVKKHFTGFEYEMIVVNNYAGDEELPSLMAKFPELIVIDNGTNPGFGIANNSGLAVAKGEYICFMNPDIIILNNILPLMQMLESDDSIGLIGPLLRNSDLSVQLSRHYLPTPKNWFAFCFSLNSIFPKITIWGNYSGNDFSYKGDAESGWVSGAFMLTRRTLMNKIGGFDPSFFMYSEDVDLCWMVQDAGYKVMFSDKSEAIHIGGVTSASKSLSKARMMAQSRIILWKKHYQKRDVRRLILSTYQSSALKAICWTMLCAMRISKKTNERDYNWLMAKLMREELKAL